MPGHDTVEKGAVANARRQTVGYAADHNAAEAMADQHDIVQLLRLD